MSFSSLVPTSGPWLYAFPVILLLCSNVFMTFAWYGHLKFKAAPLAVVILVSWGIAFVEYGFAVPSNRCGSSRERRNGSGAGGRPLTRSPIP